MLFLRIFSIIKSNIKMLSFLKKYFIFILLAFVAASLLLIRLLLKKPASLIPTPSSVPSWQGIIPGKTTTDELSSQLGQPQEIADKTYFYSSTNQFRPNEVVLKDDKVGLVKEKIIGKEKIFSDFTSKFGEPEAVLYGPDSPAGFYLHLFLKNGLAVLANSEGGTVLEVWYFSPTTLSEFIAEWGNGYNQSRPRQY